MLSLAEFISRPQAETFKSALTKKSKSRFYLKYDRRSIFPQRDILLPVSNVVAACTVPFG